jgi:hypothetical protein
MKSTFLFLSVCCLILMASCVSKEVQPMSNVEFKCKVDGVVVTTKVVSATVSNSKLSIRAYWTDAWSTNRYVEFTILNVLPKIPQTYKLVAQGDKAIVYFDERKGKEPFSSDVSGTPDGTLTVSSIDSAHSMMSGTFSFTARNNTGSVVITEGTFTTYYTDDTYKSNSAVLSSTWKANGIQYVGTDLSYAVVDTTYGGFVKVVAEGSSGRRQDIFFGLPKLIRPGTYDLVGGYNRNYAINYGINYDTISYIPKAGATSKITIVSTDTVKKVIKATFCGVLAKPSGGADINITDGKFEILYFAQ